MNKATAAEELRWIRQTYAQTDEEFEALTFAIKELEKRLLTPCCEKLPEENGEYITYMNSGRFMVVDYYEGYWNATEYSHDHAFEDGSVIAWMPVPEPYKREGGEDE